MSRIDQLLAALCPEGVEFKTLGDVVEVLDNLRKPISKDKREPGDIPYYGANGIQGYVKDYIFDGIHLLLGEDGSVINKDKSPVLNWAEGPIWVNNHAHVLGEKADTALLRYVYFYLSTVDVFDVVRGTPPKINQANMRAIRIAIPPLEIQQEIVKVLDTFTKLEAELEAELEARRRQYKYYRDALIGFNGHTDVKWRALGDIAEFRRGTAITEKETTHGKIPVVANGPVPTYFHGESNRSGETIVIARSGAYAGYVSFWNQPLFLTDAFSVHPNTKFLNPKFVYYFLQNKQDHIHTMKKGSGVPHVRVKEFESFQIPVLQLDEQNRIVAILDKFDALVNDLSSGLPAEIKARRQQYAHYRDRLLSFREAT